MVAPAHFGPARSVSLQGWTHGARVALCRNLLVGLGLLTAAVVSAAVGSLPSQYAGLASGLNNTARQVVGAVGIALYGAVVGGRATGDAFVRGLHVLAWIGAAL
jgi:DHA2 family methylenomycin A resistance protein-like MFS transporter